jgi:hypothetical protein
MVVTEEAVKRAFTRLLNNAVTELDEVQHQQGVGSERLFLRKETLVVTSRVIIYLKEAMLCSRPETS